MPAARTGVFEGMIPGTPRYSRSLIEDEDGILWAGTIFDGMLRLELTPAGPRSTTFGSGEMDIARVGGRILAIRKGEILEPFGDGQLRRDPLLGHVRGKYFAIAEDSQGNVWANGRPPVFVRRMEDGRYAREPLPVVTIEAPRVQMLEADGGVMWASTGPRLYRYETAGSRTRSAAGSALMRRHAAKNGHRPSAFFRRLRIELAGLLSPGTLYQ